MANDFESALKELLKNVVREVAADLLKVRQIPDRPPLPETAGSDDGFLLTRRETAKRLAVSERHLNKLTRAGVLPCVRVGNCVRYSVETIREWIRETEATGRLPRQGGVGMNEEAEAANVKKAAAKPAAKLKAKSNSAKKAAAVPVKKSKPEPVYSRRSGFRRSSGEQRPSPFSLLLDELGVDRNSLPRISNRELMQIAEVDVPTLHGWLYLDRALPAAAMNKLREHFSSSRNAEGPKDDVEADR